MFTTSQDILNISIAVSVAILVIFLCLALYYLIASLKRINRLSRQIEAGVSKADQLLDLIKNKVKQSQSYLILLGTLLEKGFDYFNQKRQGKESEVEESNSVRRKKSKKQ